MSWRAESTFKPTSKLSEEEKEWLKLAKKFREILKLEERQTKGEVLEGLQQEKVASKDKLLKEVSSLAAKLPPETEVLQKNQDVADLLPDDVFKGMEKRKKQEQRRSEQRAEQEVREREKPQFQDRHEKPIVDVALAADGRHLFTCSKDKAVLCWTMKDRLLQVVCTFAGHKGAVFSVAAAPGPCGLASGGADGEVHFWQADPAKLKVGSVVAPVASLDHKGIVRVLRWCPFDAPGAAGGGRLLASASEKLLSTPPAICVWRVGDRGKVDLVLRIDDPKVLPGKANDLKWGDGAKTKLFSCHDNGYVGVWSTDAPGSLLKTIKLHAGPIMSLALASDGKQIVTASKDESSAVVDVSKPSTDTLHVYKANRPLNAVCLTEDFKAGESGAGAVVFAGGMNERDVTTRQTHDDEFESKVRDAASGDEVASTNRSHFGPVHRLLSLPGLRKGGAFASVSEDGTLKVHGWDGRLLHSDTIE